MSDNESNSKTDHQLNHCFKALGALRRTIRERNWDRLPKVKGAFDRQITELQSLLASSGPLVAGSEAGIRLHQLEVEVRRVQRQLTLQMTDVRENIETIETGLRKIQKVQQERH